MPIDAILVELIEDCQAVFLASTFLGLTVVWLRAFKAENLMTHVNKGFVCVCVHVLPSRRAPIVIDPVGGWCQLLEVRSPEPAVHI